MTISDSEIAQIVRIATNPAHLDSDFSLPAYFERQVKRLVNRLIVAERALDMAHTGDWDTPSSKKYAEQDLKAEGKLLDV